MITDEQKILSVMSINLEPFGTFLKIKDYKAHLNQESDIPVVLEGCLHTYGGNSHFRVGIWDAESKTLYHAEFVDFGDQTVDLFKAKKLLAKKILESPVLKHAVLGPTPSIYYRGAYEIYPVGGVSSMEEAKRFLPPDCHHRLIETDEMVYMDVERDRVDFKSKWLSLKGLVPAYYDMSEEKWIPKMTV